MVGIEYFSLLGIFVFLFIFVRCLFREGRIYVISTLIVSSVICTVLSYESDFFISAFLGWFLLVPIPVSISAWVVKYNLKNT